jgi:hypothetical protein
MYAGVSHHRACARTKPIGALVVSKLCDSEVENLRALSAERFAIANHEQVLGLEIAMHDAGDMRSGERARDLARDANRVVRMQRTTLGSRSARRETPHPFRPVRSCGPHDTGRRTLLRSHT